MKKIAFLVPYRFVPPHNGGHKAAYGFASFLSSHFSLYVISTTNNASEKRFKLIPLFKDIITKYISPIVAWKIGRYLHKENITHCILFQPFMGLIFIILKPFFKINYSVYVQNLEFERFKTIGKWWWSPLFFFEKVVYQNAQTLFFISSEDQDRAISIFSIQASNSWVVPYGTFLKSPPNDISISNRIVRERHHIEEEEFLIIFFGPQSYFPNLEAVKLIIDHINPLLQARARFKYRFLICGGGLPKAYSHFKNLQEQGIEYLGFVEDIEQYVKASNLMINPILSGGGIKTKVIEAIAMGKTVLTSRTGSLGVEPITAGPKLIMVDDHDYSAYVKHILALQQQPPPPTPNAFYQRYHWGKAIQPVVKVLGEVQ